MSTATTQTNLYEICIRIKNGNVTAHALYEKVLLIDGVEESRKIEPPVAIDTNNQAEFDTVLGQALAASLAQNTAKDEQIAHLKAAIEAAIA